LEAGGHGLLWLTVLSLWAVAILKPENEASRHAAWALVVDALGLYVVVNVLLQGLGVGASRSIFVNELDRPAVMLRAFGVNSQRILFPMAAGLTGFGGVAGAALVASVGNLMAIGSVRRRIWSVLVGASSVFAILATDSRSAVLYAGVTVLLAFPLRKATRRIASYLPILPIAVSVSLALLAKGLGTSGGLPDLARSTSDFLTLNSRTIVWSTALSNLGSPAPMHLIGYGYEGHFASGISAEYQYWFGSYVNPKRVGLHNAILQYVFDSGYLGGALFLFSFSIILRAFSKEAGAAGGRSGNSQFALGVYLLLLGATDSAPTVYSQELFAIYLFLLVAAVSSIARAQRAESR
jgi:hypothetical protein